MAFLEDLAARLRAGDDPRMAATIAAGLKVHDALKEEPASEKAEKVVSSRLYIGNLSFDVHEDDLRKGFSECGEVVSAEIARHKQTKRSKGFGFVEMATKAQAKQAVFTMHGHELMGRKLVVSGAKAVD